MTSLYDAIGVYLDGAAGLEGRKVMLLYSDGGDTRSSMRLSDLQELLKASDVTIYTIARLGSQSSSARQQARAVLQGIAETTGGRAFFPSSVEELDDLYEQIVADIRAQYTLGYVSTNDRADGRWRKVEVRLGPGAGADLRVRSRRGYYAPYRVGSRPR
jgi:Ca-activated chloride channel family protein